MARSRGTEQCAQASDVHVLGGNLLKLLTFEHSGSQRLGALLPEGIVDLTAAGGDPALSSMQALIEGGSAGLAKAQDAAAGATAFIDPESVRWLAPLPRPLQIRDSLGFEEHLQNSFAASIKLMSREAPDPKKAEAELRASKTNAMLDTFRKQPIYYKANRFAVTGTDTDVIWPDYSQVMDFELEMACVIGKRGRDITATDAAGYIWGYTIFNDFSARDAQMVEMNGLLGPCKGKDFDNANAMGPVIVTADEIGDPYDLYMRARVNGETWCDSSSATMNWRFTDMIAHISRGETLFPGEIIGSGTVGMGCGLEHMRFLSDGDVVELEIEKIGILRNRVLRSQ